MYPQNLMDFLAKQVPVPAQGSFTLWGPWVFCLGIAIWFLLPNDPEQWLGPLVLIVVCGLLGILYLQKTPHLRMYFLLAMLAAFFAGFVLAGIRSDLKAAPVLPAGENFWLVTGKIAKIDRNKGHRARYLIRVKQIEGLQPEQTPVFVRVGGPVGTAETGAMVRFQASMHPPQSPTVPGGFSYSRAAWFEQIGGTGFTFGHLSVIAPPIAESYFISLAKVRQNIAITIRVKIPGQAGAIASAIITGERDAIEPQIVDAFRGAGLSHLLAISGLHMSVFGGMAFLLSSLVFAAIPAIGSKMDARKPAAIIGLLAAFFYLLVSGAAAPAQRAFIMFGLILLAVLLGRRALSIRTISIAAFVVALLSPEYVISAGFQMSFAASLALITVYQYAGPWFAERGRRSSNAYILLKPLHYLLLAALGIALTSIIAGVATAPFASWHFHQIALYSLIGNLMAMPVFTFLVMPFLFLGILLYPLGLEAPFWWLAGFGLDIIQGAALATSEFPGAILSIKHAPEITLILQATGLVIFCIGGKWLRFTGVLLVAIGLFLHVRTPVPDIWIGQNGGVILAKNGEHKTPLVFGKPNQFALKEFMQTSGVANVNTMALSQDIKAQCDQYGCTYQLGENRLAIQTSMEELVDACQWADMVILPEPALTAQRPACEGIVLLTYQQDAGSLIYFDKTLRDIKRPSYNRIWDRAGSYMD